MTSRRIEKGRFETLRRIGRRLLLGSALVIGVLMAIGHYLPLPEEAKSASNPLQEYVVQQLPLYQQVPTATLLHVVPSLLLMILLGLQVIPQIRKRYPGVHRIVGRILVCVSLVMTLSGLYIAFVMPFGGIAETVVTVIISATFFSFIYLGYRAIKRKDIAAHKKWMMRVTAAALTPITMRLMFAPTIALFDISAREAFAPLLLIALILNVLIMNIYLHKRKANKQAPSDMKLIVNAA